MPETACVDASFVLPLLIPEIRSAQVEAVWSTWIAGDREVVSAPLFFAEVTSVLRQKVFLRQILEGEGERAFAQFLRLPIRNVVLPDLQERAWAIAQQYGLPRAYDAQYLAVATYRRCEFWTGDKRLANAVRQPWVRLIEAPEGQADKPTH